jgi:hypothetical protein
MATDLPAHSPGPWELNQDWLPPEHPDWRAIYLDRAHCIQVSGHIGEANARLIIAAPDLLTLAKKYASECGACLDGKDSKDEDCVECAEIRAVIAKAEGR